VFKNQCMLYFRLHFSSRFAKIRTSNFRGNILKVWWAVYMAFVGNLVLFPMAKEFWNMLRTDKVMPWFCCTTFWGTVWCSETGQLAGHANNVVDLTGNLSYEKKLVNATPLHSIMALYGGAVHGAIGQKSNARLMSPIYFKCLRTGISPKVHVRVA